MQIRTLDISLNLRLNIVLGVFRQWGFEYSSPIELRTVRNEGRTAKHSICTVFQQNVLTTKFFKLFKVHNFKMLNIYLITKTK